LLRDPLQPSDSPAQSPSPEGASGERPSGRGLEQLSERFLGKPAEPAEAARRLAEASEAAVSGDLHALRAAALALAAKPAEPEAALEAVLQATLEVVGASAIRLYSLDAQGLLKMSAGRSRWEDMPFLALVLRLEAGTLGRVARCPEPVLMRERFEVTGPPEVATSTEVHCLALPLSVRAQARGVLLIFREAPFTPVMRDALRESLPGLALVFDYLELLSATLKRGNHPPGK